jgi:sulfhydrogenase subunit beta (sulfur reductase)
MNLQKDYDILFQDKDDNAWFIDVNSEKGQKLIDEIKKKINLPDHKEDVVFPKTEKQLKKGDLWPFFDKDMWKGDVDQCVSCQRCTVLCPTCFCFDLNDELDLSLDMKEGSRNRVIDSCHSKDFTRVAGNHDFREERSQRYMHRVYHKLQSYKDKFDRSMCTGCGRCIDYCHSKIDFVETANNLIEIGGKK